MGCGETTPSLLIRFSALLGVLQNDAASMIIDDSPFLDLVQGSKAAEASEVVVQAAIADAQGLSEAASGVSADVQSLWRGDGTSEPHLAMKSSGSKMTWVVLSR